MSPPSSTRLILVCGLPGSGKTTLTRRLPDEGAAIRLCPDERMAGLGIDLWDEGFRGRLEAQLWDLTQVLRRGQSVVLEFGFWSRAERDQKRLRARALGVTVELHCLHAPIDELARRLAPATRRTRRSAARTRSTGRPLRGPGSAEPDLFDRPASVPHP
jgi:predicted kinase